jgi:hypothetical protein
MMMDKDEADQLFDSLLAMAGGDVEKVARTAVAKLEEKCTELKLVERRLALLAAEVGLALAAMRATTPTKRRRGRPPTANYVGMYHPVERRTARKPVGAPQTMPVAIPTKIIAIKAYEREQRRVAVPGATKFNARIAAIIELIINDVSSDDPRFENMVHNLQNRINEIGRGNK